MGQGAAALQTSALPSELATQRMASLYSMLSGMAPSNNSIMAGLGQVGGQTGQMLGNAQAGNAALMQMLGALAPAIAQIGQGGTPPYAETHGTPKWG